MGRIKRKANASRHHEEGIYLGSPSSALVAAKQARVGAEGVIRRRTAVRVPNPRPEVRSTVQRPPATRRRGGERRPVTRTAAKAAADWGQDAHSTAENAHGFTQEGAPVLVGRKKTNHEQADGDCKSKRVVHPAMKNDDKEPAPPEEIFEALREIPSLGRADLLRAYIMLIRDDRLFRSLMALPEDMRNDVLQMEMTNHMFRSLTALPHDDMRKTWVETQMRILCEN